MGQPGTRSSRCLHLARPKDPAVSPRRALATPGTVHVEHRQDQRDADDALAAPSSTIPADGAISLDRVDDITLSFAEPIDPRDLARMVSIELRALPGTGTAARQERSRWLTHNDFTVKTMDRRGRADVATYVLALESPVPLGTRAIVHFRLSLNDDAAVSFAEVAFATAEPFRIADVGCRSTTAALPQTRSAVRRSYPIAPKGSRYSQDQALRCGNERQVLIEFSAPLGAMSAVEGRNLVHFSPPVDDLTFASEGNTLVVTICINTSPCSAHRRYRPSFPSRCGGAVGRHRLVWTCFRIWPASPASRNPAHTSLGFGGSTARANVRGCACKSAI